jgi:hypothetical protein
MLYSTWIAQVKKKMQPGANLFWTSTPFGHSSLFFARRSMENRLDAGGLQISVLSKNLLRNIKDFVARCTLRLLAVILRIPVNPPSAGGMAAGLPVVKTVGPTRILCNFILSYVALL